MYIPIYPSKGLLFEALNGVVPIILGPILDPKTTRNVLITVFFMLFFSFLFFLLLFFFFSLFFSSFFVL